MLVAIVSFDFVIRVLRSLSLLRRSFLPLLCFELASASPGLAVDLVFLLLGLPPSSSLSFLHYSFGITSRLALRIFL